MTGFADFWAEYPRKKGKAMAMEALEYGRGGVCISAVVGPVAAINGL